MSANEESIKTLIDLGLTGAQAKIYLSLLNSGPTSTKEISRASKVARPDVYRALTELQESGIVEKLIEIPTKFKSLPIIDAISVLMVRRTKESIELNKRANKLIECLKEKSKEEKQADENKLILIPGEALDIELRKLYESTKNNISTVVSRHRLMSWVFKNYEVIKAALKRKVTIRIITEEPYRANTIHELNELSKFENFEIRHIVGPITSWFRIFDNKLVVLSTAIKPGNPLESAVLSNNPNLIELTQNFFSSSWYSAIEPLDQIFKKDSKQFEYLFANMITGFAYCKMVFDQEEHPMDFIYVQMNELFEKMTGIKKEDAIGKKVTDLIPGIKDSNPELFEIYGRVASSGKGEKFEVFFKPLNLWLSISVYSPEKGYFAAIFEDITEHKRAEYALNESEEKFRNLAEESPNMIFIYTKNKIAYVNRKCETTLGFTKQEFCSHDFNFLNIIDPEDKESMLSNLRKHMQNEETPPLEYVLITKTGEKIEAMLNTKLIKYEEENAILGITTDIRELKKMEHDIVQQRDTAERYLNIVGNIILALDAQGKITLLNRKGYEILGYEEGELEGKDWINTCLPAEIRRELRKVFDNWIQGKVKTPQNYENKVITKDGEIKLINWYNTELRNSSDQFLGTLSSGEDVTERKRAEMELRQTFEVLERVGEGIDAGLAVIGKDYRVVWANERLMSLGVSPNKKCYQTFNRSDTICTDCGAKKIFEQNTSCDIHEFETVNSKGEKTWIELRVTPLKDKNGNLTAALEFSCTNYRTQKSRTRIKGKRVKIP